MNFPFAAKIPFLQKKIIRNIAKQKQKFSALKYLFGSTKYLQTTRSTLGLELIRRQGEISNYLNKRNRGAELRMGFASITREKQKNRNKLGTNKERVFFYFIWLPSVGRGSHGAAKRDGIFF